MIQQTVATRLPQLLGSARTSVTVTGVDASSDLRQATVWFGIAAADPEPVFEEVQQLRPELQRQVAKVMTTKFVPRLALKLDTGGAYAQSIERLLRDT